ncbi:MAG: aryl-sulfate sulfotransferase [Pseudobdellovibrio sp.]
MKTQPASEYSGRQIFGNCLLFNTQGKFIRYLNGSMCLLQKDGSTFIYKENNLAFYDKNFKQKWLQNDLVLHHQMKFSSDETQILTIASDYRPDKKYGMLRNDQLLVLDKSGKILKSFNFKNYLKNKRGLVQPYINDWSTDEFKNKSYETTHVNSFAEILQKTASGEELTGYIAHCNLQKKIYVFNRELTQITQEISTGNKSIHDVQPYTDNRLIYYMNQNYDLPEPHVGSIETYNLKTQQFATLYGPFNENISALAGSSVQVLDNERLFIVHSSTLPRPGSNAETFFFEFADLKNKTGKIIKVEKIKSLQGARLIDANDYLKNNIGN